MKQIARYIFLSISIIELIAVSFDVALLNFAVKPLIMISLVFYYLVSTPHRNLLFIIAMGVCWLGDVLLLFQAEQSFFFMAGLISFLAGHVLYIICYRNLRGEKSDEWLGPQKVRYALPFVLVGTGLVAILYPSLNELTVPVMMYALVLTIMVLQALFRFGYTNKKSYALVFTGAIFFMISDSLLAINKFLKPVPLASLWIMLTYITAQYLIVEGALAHYTNLKLRKT